jgi:hypothetical protein
MTGESQAIAIPDTRPGIVTLDVLRYLGLDPTHIEARTLVLTCTRYKLDPLLGHVTVITTRGKKQVYITRDGYLEIAHRSGHLDGIEVVEERRNSTQDGWTAYVRVYRNDMAHPFTYGAQCKDGEDQARAGRGPEMALARAERRALKRAFNVPVANLVTGDDVEVYEVDDDTNVVAPVGEADAPSSGPSVPIEGGADGPGVTATPRDQRDAHKAVGALTDEERAAFLDAHGIDDFAAAWPIEAVRDALELPL